MKAFNMCWLVMLVAASACAGVDSGLDEQDHGEVGVSQQEVQRGRVYELRVVGAGEDSTQPFNLEAIVKIFYPDPEQPELGLAHFWFVNHGDTQARIAALLSLTCTDENQNISWSMDFDIAPGDNDGHTFSCYRPRHADLEFTLDN